MFQNINASMGKNAISSFLKVALLSLLVAGCTKKRMEEVVTIEEVELDGRLSLNKQSSDSIKNMISQVKMIRDRKEDSKMWIVVHVHTSKDGSVKSNAKAARARAEKAKNILKTLGYEGPVAFVFCPSSDKKGVVFSVPEPCGETDLKSALIKVYGSDGHHHHHHQGKKAAPAVKPVAKDDDEDDDEVPQTASPAAAQPAQAATPAATTAAAPATKA